MNDKDTVVVPREPTEDMWGGLARQIILWMDMHPMTPRALFDYLRCSGHDVPQWLRDEPEMQNLDHVPSKGTRAVLIYRAMIAAAPSTSVREEVRAEIINTPETADFMAGVPLEAAHQRERWGVSHDGGKTPFDWFWLIGYLAQKAASAQVAGDDNKALHHTISTAAALANWHAQIAGRTDMRPGIGPDNGGEKPGSAYSLAAALKPSTDKGGVK